MRSRNQLDLSINSSRKERYFSENVSSVKYLWLVTLPLYSDLIDLRFILLFLYVSDRFYLNNS